MKSDLPVWEPPHVADNIIFASSPAEAKEIAESLGVAFEDVQWYRSAALLGDADVSDKKVHYSPTFTHRSDYAQTRERVKIKGRGKQ
jgi:hypothetical protein